MSPAARVLTLLLTLLVGAGAGTWWGQQLERKNQDAIMVAELKATLTAHADLAKRSSEASQALRLASARMAKTQAKTYKEISDELQASAPGRAGCVFPAGVMRGIGTARDHAADAAARGIVHTVPPATAGPSDER